MAHFDINGLTMVELDGDDSGVTDVMAGTLEAFKVGSGNPDLKLVIGRYPTNDWAPKGYTVGDRLLYDFESKATTVFRRATASIIKRDEVEYVIVGDVRREASPVTAYIPHPAGKVGFSRRTLRGVYRRSLSRALLSALGSDFYANEEVELDAARARLAILEPFLYYRLPFKGSSLVHGSVVSRDGKGVMFAGSGHIGKTTLALEMVKKGFSYLCDDLGIVNDRGIALPYAEPVRIQEQHLSIFPGLAETVLSRMGGREQFFLRRMLKSNPGEVLNLMPRLQISEIVEGAEVGGPCRLERIVLVRKGVVNQPSYEEADPGEVARALASELFWEFEAGHWRHTQYLLCPSCAQGKDFLAEEAEHHRLVMGIIERAVGSSQTFILRVPYEFPIRNALRYMDDLV